MGYNINLCNLQSVQNKLVYVQLLFKLIVIQVKDFEIQRYNKDKLIVGKIGFDWSGYFVLLVYFQEKVLFLLLFCYLDLLWRLMKYIFLLLKEMEFFFKNFYKQLFLEILFFFIIKEQYIFYLKNFLFLLKKKIEEDFVVKMKLKMFFLKFVVFLEIK